MVQEWLSKSDSCDTLLIFFGGWSSSRELIERILDFADCDRYIIYDYRTIEPLNLDYSRYGRVVVVAWSFGVYVASLVDLPASVVKIAVNGTPMAIDDNYGIPVNAFELTLASISRFGMSKFNRRISRGVEEYFVASNRDIDVLVDELKALYDSYNSLSAGDVRWNYSLVSQKDMIFPPQNQLNYWNKNSIFAPILIDLPHYPFDVECKNILKERLTIDK